MKGWWNIQTSVKPSAITTQRKVGQTLLLVLYLVTICISYKVPPSMVNQFKGKCANSSSDFRRLKNCNATHLPPPMIQAVEQYLQSEMKSSAELQNIYIVPVENEVLQILDEAQIGCASMSFLDAQASLAPTHVSLSVRWLVILSNFHSISVSGCST